MLATAARQRASSVEIRRTALRPARRVRRPLWVAIACLVCVVAPALLLVFLRTHAASTGYEILALRQDIELLQTENARLLSTAASLRSLDRVEHMATATLGLAPPRQQQVASLTIAPQAAQAILPLSLWLRVGSWLTGRAEAKTR